MSQEGLGGIVCWILKKGTTPMGRGRKGGPPSREKDGICGWKKGESIKKGSNKKMPNRPYNITFGGKKEGGQQ